MSSIFIPETPPSPVLNTTRSRLRRNRANESDITSLTDLIAQMSPMSSNNSSLISSNNSQINHNANIIDNPIRTKRFRKWICVKLELSLQEVATDLLQNGNIISWIALKQTDQNST
eukprot:323879_1